MDKLYFFNYTTNEISLIFNNYSHINSKEIMVSTVKNGKNLFFKIEFPNNNSSNIDIEYISAKNNRLVHYNNIPSNKTNIYYLCPEESAQTLSSIKVRSSYKEHKGEWYSVLTYLLDSDKK